MAQEHSPSFPSPCLRQLFQLVPHPACHNGLRPLLPQMSFMLLKAQHRDRGDRAEHLGSLDGSRVCMSVILPSGLYCCLMWLFLLFWRWGQNLHLMLGKHFSAQLQPFLVYNLSLQITYLTRCFETLFKILVFMLYMCECLHICAHVSDGY